MKIKKEKCPTCGRMVGQKKKTNICVSHRVKKGVKGRTPKCKGSGVAST